MTEFDTYVYAPDLVTAIADGASLICLGLGPILSATTV